jgi:hypothetical protein
VATVNGGVGQDGGLPYHLIGTLNSPKDRASLRRRKKGEYGVLGLCATVPAALNMPISYHHNISAKYCGLTLGMQEGFLVANTRTTDISDCNSK